MVLQAILNFRRARHLIGDYFEGTNSTLTSKIVQDVFKQDFDVQISSSKDLPAISHVHVWTIFAVFWVHIRYFWLIKGILTIKKELRVRIRPLKNMIQFRSHSHG